MAGIPSKNIRLLRWALAVYWTFIYLLTHIPNIDRFAPKNTPPDFDKVVHFFMYAGWATLWCWLLQGVGRRLDRSVLLWILVGGAAYGVFDELTQAIVDRTPDIFDWTIDMVGVSTALLICRAWQSRKANL